MINLRRGKPNNTNFWSSVAIVTNNFYENTIYIILGFGFLIKFGYFAYQHIWNTMGWIPGSMMGRLGVIQWTRLGVTFSKSLLWAGLVVTSSKSIREKLSWCSGIDIQKMVRNLGETQPQSLSVTIPSLFAIQCFELKNKPEEADVENSVWGKGKENGVQCFQSYFN